MGSARIDTAEYTLIYAQSRMEDHIRRAIPPTCRTHCLICYPDPPKIALAYPLTARARHVTAPTARSGNR